MLGSRERRPEDRNSAQPLAATRSSSSSSLARSSPLHREVHVGLALVVLEHRLQFVDQARVGRASRRRSSACNGPAGALADRPAPRRSPRASGSKGSASCTTSLVSPRSLWSSRPRTRTTASGSITAALSASVGLEDEHLDLALEVVERREHHLAPLLVRIFFASATIPPTVTQAPSGLPAELGERAVDPGAQRRRGPRRAGARRGTCPASPSPSPAARAVELVGRRSAAGAGRCDWRAAAAGSVAEVEDRALARAGRPPAPSGRPTAPPAAPRACPCGSPRSSRARRT